MEGGLFYPLPGWEALLPAGIRRLHAPGQVCRQRWELLALTAAGCAMLAGRQIAADILLLPGDCAPGSFQAGTVVTCGLSPRDSITLSSLTEPVLCIQRALPLARGGILEPQEFPLPGLSDARELLVCLGARLLWTGSPYL